MADEKFESGMTEQERQEKLRSGVDPIKKGDGSGTEGDEGFNPGSPSGGGSGSKSGSSLPHDK